MNACGFTLSLPRALREVRLTGKASPVPDDTEEKIRRCEQAAYERGRQEGERALQEQLLRQRNEMVELQRGVIESLRQSLPQVMRECEHTLTALCLEVARKLVASAPITAEMAEGAVREALGQVAEASEFDIYLHPADLELLQKFNSQLLSQSPDGQSLHFHPSPEVSRGGCIVKTRFGIIDAQRETKFELLKKSLLA